MNNSLSCFVGLARVRARASLFCFLFGAWRKRPKKLPRRWTRRGVKKMLRPLAGNLKMRDMTHLVRLPDKYDVTCAVFHCRKAAVHGQNSTAPTSKRFGLGFDRWVRLSLKSSPAPVGRSTAQANLSDSTELKPYTIRRIERSTPAASGVLGLVMMMIYI